ESGNDLAIVSGGAVTFEAVKDLHQESHEKSKGDLAWQSSKGKGQTDETVRQTQIVAQGNLAIKAVEGLKIDLKHIDQKTVSQTIDAMVQADPQLAWLKEAEQRGDVDWRMVREVHDSWKYSNSGMGPATQIAVAIAAAAIGGMAAAGALSGAGVGASSFAMGAGVGAAGSLSGTAAVSLINNKGDLGKVLKDSFSSDSLKQIAIASLTGGLTAEYFNSWSGAEAHTKIVGGKTVADFSSWGGIGSFAANQGMQNVTSAALSKALGQGGSFGEAFRSSLYNTFAAAGFNQVGNFGSLNELAPGSPPMVAMHALMGGVVSVVSGGDFATGAAAAGANEALVASLDKTFSNLSPDTREQLLTTSSQLIGVLAVVASDQNASSHQLETGAWIAKNSTQYNHELHRANAKSFVNAALDFCKAQPSSCAPGAEKLTQQDLIAALEATAAHGEGKNNVKPAALDVVNIFLTNPDLADTLKEDLFTPTASERERLKVNDTAELAMAGISLAQAAKAVLLGNGKALSKLVTGLRKESGEVAAKGTATAGKVTDEFIPPGMDRPFRPVNPEFPPNKTVVDAMDSPQIQKMTSCGGTDCSEIADKLLAAAGGKGKIIEVRPSERYNLNLYENGREVQGQAYHQVYTDGRYVYDPRLSSQPIPKGDWEQHIKGMNPDGVTISDKLEGLR
ncbi:TPA: hypothetical protein L6A07_00005, partial [Pseudomonas aeruginosa]|nr:hypothetical protein [Pseudomonas aeruginosa]